jgi:2-methylcitrate synthase
VTTEGCSNPEKKDRSNTRELVVDLIGKMGPALIYWYHFSHSGIRLTATQTHPKDSIAANFLKLLRMGQGLYNDPDFKGKKVSQLETKALDVSLILYAEHGFNASTFGSRITASTLSDIHSALSTGIGTLKGNLHGGANEAAMEYLENLKTTEQADAFLKNIFEKKQKLMGFGHRVYKNGDPRHKIAKMYSGLLSKTQNGTSLKYIVLTQ